MVCDSVTGHLPPPRARVPSGKLQFPRLESGLDHHQGADVDVPKGISIGSAVLARGQQTDRPLCSGR